MRNVPVTLSFFKRKLKKLKIGYIFVKEAPFSAPGLKNLLIQAKSYIIH